MGGWLSPYPDGWPTAYVSGTYTKVHGAVGAGSGAWITSATLSVNGHPLRQYSWSLGQPQAPYVYFQVAFASTHFPDGTPLTVRLHGVNSNNLEWSVARYATVYNKATIYGRYEFEMHAEQSGTPAANQFLAAMNHDVSRTVNSPGWTRNQVLGDIGACTVFYVNTHGSSLPSFLDDGSGIVYPSADYVEPPVARVLERRQEVVGSGTPPMNTGIPACNLVWIDACNAWQNNNFETFLWPYKSWWGWVRNRSLVGWRITVDSRGTRAASEAFWGGLAAGRAVSEARDRMVVHYFRSFRDHHKGRPCLFASRLLRRGRQCLAHELGDILS
jgi:hypothetical protein